MSLVTFAGQGPTLAMEALVFLLDPSSTPHRWQTTSPENFSIIWYIYTAPALPAALAHRQDNVQQ